MLLICRPREVFEALNGIFYHVKPDDEIRWGEVYDIFQRVKVAISQALDDHRSAQPTPDMKNTANNVSPQLQAFTSLLDAQPPGVQEASQFLLATAMHEAEVFELLRVAEVDRR